MPIIDVTEDAIPDDIRRIENWICWREGTRDGKPTKIPTKPYRTSGDINCDVTNPSQRRDFDTAWKTLNDGRATTDGIGFVFTDDVSITGVDLDKCRDSDTGVIEEWAEDIIDRLNSYTEISPSGTGVHILVGGTLPPGGNRKGRVEMYDSDRYFTVTGAHVEKTPTEIRKCQDDLEIVHREYIRGGGRSGGQASLSAASGADISGSRENTNGGHNTDARTRSSSSALHGHYGDAYRAIREPAVKEALERVDAKYLPKVCPSTFDDLAGRGIELSDSELLKRMFASKGGDRKQRLYEGDASMWGSRSSDYLSQSEADMAFAHTLAFWTGKDPDRMDALFRNSGLMRDKWDRRHYASGATYGEVTLARALLRVSDYYELPSEDGVTFSKADGPTNSSSSGGGPPDVPPMDWDAVPQSWESVEDFDDDAGSPAPASSSGSGPSPDPTQSPQEAAGGVGAADTGNRVQTEPGAATNDSGSLHGDGYSERTPVEADVVDLGDGQNSETTVGTDAASDPSSATTETTKEKSESIEPADPGGTDTDPKLNESTQRMMSKSVEDAGPQWSRTNPHLDDSKKHPTDWTVGPIQGRTPTAQAMRVAREDNRVLARYQSDLEKRLRALTEVEEERDRYKFTAETYLKVMDELMGERERYRAQLKRAGLLSKADAELPDDPVKHLKRILRPMVRREDVRTAKETLTGLDAVLREYEEANERIRAEERERRKQQGFLGRLFG